MKKMLRQLLCLVLFVSWLGTFANAEPIRIGVSTPLTGENAASGIDIKNAAIMANEELGAGKYQLLIEDERTPKDAVTIAQKWINIDKVSYVIGPATNATVFAASPLYNRAGIPCISPLGSTGDTQGIGSHVFRIYPADQASAEVLGPYVYERYKTVGVVSDEEEYANLIERTLVKVNNTRAVPIRLYSEKNSVGGSDYKPLFLRLKSKSIEALILNPPNEESFIRMFNQLQTLQVKWPIFTFVLPSSNTVQQALGDRLNGVVYANMPMLEKMLSKDGKQMLQRFEKRFGPPQSVPLVAALTYEAFRVLDQAIRSGKPVSDYLHQVNPKDSLIGPYSFDRDGAVQGLTFELFRVGQPLE